MTKPPRPPTAAKAAFVIRAPSSRTSGGPLLPRCLQVRTRFRGLVAEIRDPAVQKEAECQFREQVSKGTESRGRHQASSYWTSCPKCPLPPSKAVSSSLALNSLPGTGRCDKRAGPLIWLTFLFLTKIHCLESVRAQNSGRRHKYHKHKTWQSAPDRPGCHTGERGCGGKSQLLDSVFKSFISPLC